jgi:hypothetical protein
MGGSTDVDINAMVADNQGNKDELKPPFIRRTPIKWLQNRIPVYSACSGFGDVMGKAVRDSGIGTLVLAADVDPYQWTSTSQNSTSPPQNFGKVPKTSENREGPFCL